jgi:outer membrane protein
MNLKFEILKMKRNFFISTALIFILGFGQIYAQEKKWTLEDCINYAVTNNISLQRQKLLSESAEANLLKSRMDVLRLCDASVMPL